MKFVDLTQKFTADMPVWPGDPQPKLWQTEFVEKDGFGHFRVETGMHVGTHIDGPLHFIEGGKKLSEYPIEKFVGKGVLIDARGKIEIGPEVLIAMTRHSWDIMLIYTGMDKKYRKANGDPDPGYYTNSPVLTEEFARELVKTGVKMVGMDMNGPDKKPFNVHKILLGAEVLIIENLTNLDKLAGVKEFEIIALPAYFDAEAAPARVVARV